METIDGKFTDGSLDNVTFGKDLSQKLGSTLTCLVLGTNLEGQLAEVADADAIHYVEDARLENYVPDLWKQVVEGVIGKLSPKAVLVPYTSQGIDYAASVANSLDIKHVAGCIGLDVNDGVLSATCGSFGGKVILTVTADSPTNIISVMPGIQSTYELTKSGSPPTNKENADEYIKENKVTFTKFHMPDTSDVDISSVDVLVSVGRGIQDESNIELAEELAEALGATVSGSRPVIDNGWLPKTRQVGKSGKTVKPKLYLALGISGAPEHVEGMRGSDMIIAINTDEKAPIFNIAAYGVVADLFDLVPELTDAISDRG